MPLPPNTPWTRKTQLEQERVFPIDQSLIDAINAIRQRANYGLGTPVQIVAFYEDMQPDTFLPTTSDPEIVAQYAPIDCKLKKTDYVVCVRYEVAGADPSWTIVNNVRIHT